MQIEATEQYRAAVVKALDGGVTYRELAEALGIAPATLHQLVKGKRRTGTGLTLYEYVGDTPGQKPYPTCTNDSTFHCSKVWPPLYTSDRPIPGKGIKASLLGTVVRDDNHKTQVTYAGHPLYRYAPTGTAHDTKPGDVYGQNFGPGLWFVLSPSGKPIKKPRQ